MCLPRSDDLVKILKLRMQKQNIRSELNESNYQLLAQDMAQQGASGRDVIRLVNNTVK